MTYYNEFEINSCLTNLKYALNLKTPINFGRIATKISNLEILHDNDSIENDFEIIKDDDFYIIKLKPNKDKKQIRYTTAKALAYIFLGYVDNYPNLVKRFANELDYPTDYFALKLMIPSSELKNFIKNDEVNIDELSEYFKIPKEAVKYRINIYNNGD